MTIVASKKIDDKPETKLLSLMAKTDVSSELIGHVFFALKKVRNDSSDFFDIEIDFLTMQINKAVELEKDITRILEHWLAIHEYFGVE